MFAGIDSALRRAGTTPAVAALIVIAVALMGTAAPVTHASTGADATILNVATVSYKDASGTVSFTATASASVTVNLVESPLTLSGAPSGATPGDTAPLPGAATVASGDTASYVYAVTAGANGDDDYTLALTQDGSSLVSGETLESALLAPDGTTVLATNPASLTLGASVITAVTAADTLEFPAGSLDAFAVGDIVVVDGVEFAITAVSNGTVASHTNGSGPNASAGATTAETPATMTLAANTNGSNSAPAFPTGASSPLIGELAGEQVLLRVDATAAASDPTTDGTLDFDLLLEPDGTPGSNTAEVLDVTTTFTAVGLTIVKDVRNLTQGGAFGASATGDPGDVLEYRVTVAGGGSDATEVVVTDPVPEFTSLVIFSDAFGGTETGTYGAAVLVGRAALGATNVDLTADASDTEDSSVASGDVAGVAAGNVLTFYVGGGNTASSGGTVSPGDSVVLLYRVRVN